jgi:hypothetical protein
MDDQSIGFAIARAERAAGSVADPTFKEKAFEVVLHRLLLAEWNLDPQDEESRAVAPMNAHQIRQPDQSQRKEPKTLSQRIMTLQSDSFFREPRTIATVRDGLGARGWHYPVTTLSGVLQSLTQKRRLRRERVRDGRKTAWKYSNP